MQLLLCVILLFSTVLYGENQKTPALIELEQRIIVDLESIRDSTRCKWVKHSVSTKPILDVAIIGGGMAGMSVAFGLIKEGVVNIKIFDENVRGFEGPWEKCARMNYLRSGKNLMGPAMGVPNLAFRAWYGAQYGEESWKAMELVSTHIWSEYLRWYREVLRLPVQNQVTLKNILPSDKCLELIVEHAGESLSIYTRKVVLATGRDGFWKREASLIRLSAAKALLRTHERNN